MTFEKLAICTLCAGLLAGCGGGGGAASGNTGPNGTPANGIPMSDPPPPAPSRNYADLSDTTGTSPLTGAILTGGSSVNATTGTANLTNQTFTASGVTGGTSLNATSAFDLGDYDYATDVALNAGSVAIVGISTDVADVRTTGAAAFTGEFSGQLVDASQLSATTLKWDADIQINFAGDGDVDMTFTGGGSDLIDTIRITNATIAGNTFAGGTMRTANNGTTNNITGTDVDMNGAFFGYNPTLQLPGEIGGALVSNDADTDLSGVFIGTARP